MDITILPEGYFIRGQRIDDLKEHLSLVPNHEFIKVTLHASIDCEAGFVKYALDAVVDLNYRDVRLATIKSTAQ
jgi:hypothetical protein